MKYFCTLLTMFLIGFGTSQAQDVEILSESFESTTDWTTSGTCSGYPWKIASSTASEGSKSAIFESFDANPGCSAELLSPLLTVNNPGTDDSVYFTFDIYRGTSYSTKNDRIELYFQNAAGQTVNGPATIYRVYNKTPSSQSGWVSFIFRSKLSLAGSGSSVSFKIMVKGISDYGDNIFIDNFKIYHHKSTSNSTIQLTNPNGGNQLSSGTTFNVTWFSTGINKVNIDFTIDGGVSWNNIASNVDATLYTYAWIIPPVSSKTCKVRIVNAANASEKDESDSYFEIIKTPGVGIESIESNTKVYPNPAHKRLIIESNSFIQSVRLININGQEFLSRSFTNDTNQTELVLTEGIKPGIYWVEIQTEEGIIRKKVSIL